MSILNSIGSFFKPSGGCRKVTPTEAAQLVETGEAVLVDVREPDEWAETGVAKPALLIPLGQINGPAGQELLAKNKGKEIIFYCRSGGRSGAASNGLARDGVRTANAGGFSDWLKAGLPVRKV